jgi:pimeloyl-ACP methyl ester carboxylesterase
VIATVDGLALYARDYPPLAAARPALPVICLHGLTRNSRDFEVDRPAHRRPRPPRDRRLTCAAAAAAPAIPIPRIMWRRCTRKTC